VVELFLYFDTVNFKIILSLSKIIVSLPFYSLLCHSREGGNLLPRLFLNAMINMVLSVSI
jgi:hypothetical protein